MRVNIRNSVALPLLIIGLSSPTGGPATAQTFTTLYCFTPTDPAAPTNSDGASPYGAVICGGNTLYGTTKFGGSSGYGTIFAVRTDGTGFTNLHSFSALNSYTNGDGAYPQAGLVLSNNTLYGTAANGGEFANGVVFALNTDGSGFTNLHSFSAVSNSFPFGNTDGSLPYGGLCLSGYTLYGTARQGGTSGNGTVFAVDTDGTGFTNLHSFSQIYNNAVYGSGTNSDGIHPTAGLVVSGSTLYGTAANGGNFGNGTVFAVSTDGTDFTNLHSFSAVYAYPNADGQTPSAALILRGSTLYGTTVNGGLWSWGTVFALNTNGTGFTNLHSFSAIISGTNSDGANPQAGLVSFGNTLYGTTILGGEAQHGTVYALTTDSSGFTTLCAFAAGTGGYFADGGVVLSGNTLYGTLSYGGDSGNGSVFSLSFVPRLIITASEAGAILAWPTNVAGFDYGDYVLQSSENLGPSAAWQTNSQSPVISDGRYTMTNPISAAQQYFRLSK